MYNFLNYLKYILVLLIMLMGNSCEEYLDKTEEADVTEKDVFTTFYTYQGFVETMYAQIINFQMIGNSVNWNYGDDVLLANPRNIQNGNYWGVIAGGGSQQYMIPESRMEYHVGFTHNRCVWFSSWHGIRLANLALEHLDDLKEATSEERKFLEGQAYFFRGYFHWEIMKQWGGIPYIDHVISPSEEMEIPQLKFNEASEKVIADLKKAVELLPIDWNDTTVGKATYGRNRGRLTKGIALAVLTQVQLFTGSPLMNGAFTGNYTYNENYCSDASITAWEIIKMANQGIYELASWGKEYTELFKTDRRVSPGLSSEVIFQPPFYGQYSKWYIQHHVLPSMGGSTSYTSPTQNLVELFETTNGLPIDDPESGFDPMDPWSNRDPRIYFSIMFDREKIVQGSDDDVAFAKLYTGGRDRAATASQTGFGIKKYIYNTFNKYDNRWGSNGFCILPTIRLAEVYLYYAEAVNEVFGPMGTAPGANLTAVDAVNIVRNRIGMPNVHSKFTGSKETFRERIRNERSVELVFEAKRRDDLRRWHIAHLDKYKDLYGCDFPEGWSYFKKDFIKSIVFEEKHYWFPFPTNQVTLYDGWEQNPGW